MNPIEFVKNLAKFYSYYKMIMELINTIPYDSRVDIINKLEFMAEDTSNDIDNKIVKIVKEILL